MFNLLTKVYQPTTGTVLIDGKDTAGMNTVQANKLGIARTFQNIRLFGNMTVEENVRIGLHNQIKYGMFSGIFRLPAYWRQERRQHEQALDLLSIFDMQDMAPARRARCPTARSAGWRSSARWRRTRRFCCSTSQPPA